MGLTAPRMTEREKRDAHGQLRTAAALLNAGRITLDEWFRRVDPILARFEQHESARRPVRPGR